RVGVERSEEERILPERPVAQQVAGPVPVDARVHGEAGFEGSVGEAPEIGDAPGQRDQEERAERQRPEPLRPRARGGRAGGGGGACGGAAVGPAGRRLPVEHARSPASRQSRPRAGGGRDALCSVRTVTATSETAMPLCVYLCYTPGCQTKLERWMPSADEG